MNLVRCSCAIHGLGCYQAFLRYASDARGQREEAAFAYAFSRGVVASLVLIGMLQALAPVVCNAIPECSVVQSGLGCGVLVMEYVKSYARPFIWTMCLPKLT